MITSSTYALLKPSHRAKFEIQTNKQSKTCFSHSHSVALISWSSTLTILGLTMCMVLSAMLAYTWLTQYMTWCNYLKRHVHAIQRHVFARARALLILAIVISNRLHARMVPTIDCTTEVFSSERYSRLYDAAMDIGWSVSMKVLKGYGKPGNTMSLHHIYIP